MKVTTAIGDFRVRWDYKSKKNVTQCIITDISDGNNTEISTGESKLRKGDVFDKNTGRKISLTKAIAHFNRTDRMFFWDAYNNRKTRTHQPIQKQEILA